MAGFYFLKTPTNWWWGPFKGKRLVRSPSARVYAVRRSSATRRCWSNVYAFPGHIFCDGGSRSELVVPLFHEGRVLGVFDLDSPSIGRFDAEDRAGMEEIARIYVAASTWPA